MDTGILQKILKSNKKPKEKVSILSEKIKRDKELFKERLELLKNGTDIENGTCADIMKHVSADKPEYFIPLSFLVLLPALVLIAWKDARSIIPILIMTIILGTLLGAGIGKFTK